MVPYFQRMKLVPSSCLRPHSIMDQITTVILALQGLINTVKRL